MNVGIQIRDGAQSITVEQSENGYTIEGFDINNEMAYLKLEVSEQDIKGFVAQLIHFLDMKV